MEPASPPVEREYRARPNAARSDYESAQTLAGQPTDAPPTPAPIRRSPLEFGRWYTKPAFEQHYQTRRWRHLVVICGGERGVRVQPDDLQHLLRAHKDAYFQLAWNDQPYQREKKIKVKGRHSVERFTTIATTDPPYTTVKLWICYALTPERDTEVILHDGYGLPEIERWWERAQGYTIALPLPADRATQTVSLPNYAG